MSTLRLWLQSSILVATRHFTKSFSIPFLGLPDIQLMKCNWRPSALRHWLIRNGDCSVRFSENYTFWMDCRVCYQSSDVNHIPRQRKDTCVQVKIVNRQSSYRRRRIKRTAWNISSSLTSSPNSSVLIIIKGRRITLGIFPVWLNVVLIRVHQMFYDCLPDKHQFPLLYWFLLIGGYGLVLLVAAVNGWRCST